jgi:hypothetical protein
VEEFLSQLTRFVESREFLSEDDGDPDVYRMGYRAGYWDALNYVLEWLEEEVGE